MLKQSFCYPCFISKEIDLDRLCSAAAGIGYAGIELWSRDQQFDELVRSAHRHGLRIISMCGHQSLSHALNDPTQHDRIEDEIRTSVQVAIRHEIPNLICFAGNRIDGQTDDEALQVCARGLRRLAPHAEQAGVMLNLELLNSKVDHPGYLADRSAWAVALCQEVNSPRVKLLYDIYHMQVMEGDIIRTIRQNIQWIGHFHTAGNPGRHDLDDDQELNYPAICRAIVASGYQGYLAHEFTPHGDRLEALACAHALCCVTSDRALK